MKTIGPMLGVSLLAILHASCAGTSTGRYGDNLNDTALSHIEVDMPMSEVRSLIGTPTSVTTLSEGRELWTYMYRIEETDGGPRYVPIPSDGKGPPEGAVTVMFFSTKGVAFVHRQ